MTLPTGREFSLLLETATTTTTTTTNLPLALLFLPATWEPLACPWRLTLSVKRIGLDLATAHKQEVFQSCLYSWIAVQSLNFFLGGEAGFACILIFPQN